MIQINRDINFFIIIVSYYFILNKQLNPIGITQQILHKNTCKTEIQKKARECTESDFYYCT